MTGAPWCDAAETWVCSTSLALLAGVGLYALFGWWWADLLGAGLCLAGVAVIMYAPRAN